MDFLIRKEIHQQDYINSQISIFGDENMERSTYPYPHIYSHYIYDPSSVDKYTFKIYISQKF